MHSFPSPLNTNTRIPNGSHSSLTAGAHNITPSLLTSHHSHFPPALWAVFSLKVWPIMMSGLYCHCHNVISMYVQSMYWRSAGSWPYSWSQQESPLVLQTLSMMWNLIIGLSSNPLQLRVGFWHDFWLTYCLFCLKFRIKGSLDVISRKNSSINMLEKCFFVW